jgi:hypothetical protein
MLHTPFKADLPRVLDDIKYRVTKGDHGEMVWHIDCEASRFQRQDVSDLNNRQRRKIETHIMLSYPREQVKLSFD